MSAGLNNQLKFFLVSLLDLVKFLDFPSLGYSSEVWFRSMVLKRWRSYSRVSSRSRWFELKSYLQLDIIKNIFDENMLTNTRHKCVTCFNTCYLICWDGLLFIYIRTDPILCEYFSATISNLLLTSIRTDSLALFIWSHQVT